MKKNKLKNHWYDHLRQSPQTRRFFVHRIYFVSRFQQNEIQWLVFYYPGQQIRSPYTTVLHGHVLRSYSSVYGRLRPSLFCLGIPSKHWCDCFLLIGWSYNSAGIVLMPMFNQFLGYFLHFSIDFGWSRMRLIMSSKLLKKSYQII